MNNEIENNTAMEEEKTVEKSKEQKDFKELFNEGKILYK
jgi:hypothetical protein